MVTMDGTFPDLHSSFFCIKVTVANGFGPITPKFLFTSSSGGIAEW